MKLEKLLEREESSVEYANKGKAMSSEELAQLVKIVEPEEMSKSDIKMAAHDLGGSNGFLRSPAAAELSLIRIHAMIHGILPHGESPRASNFFNPSGPMVDFLRRQGYDVDVKLEAAKRDSQERMEAKNRKRTKEVALSTMSSFYKEHRNNLDPSVTKHRDEIVQKLMSGETPEEALARFVK